MRPSALKESLHVGIIMDGNGRWAIARGRPRVAGHIAGAESVRRVVEQAPRLGIATLTLYAFSSDNWQRPAREVAALMRLFRKHLASETPKLLENGVRLSVIGRRDRLSLPLTAAIAEAERATANGRTLHLRLAVDYSARDAIVHAARLLGGTSETSRETSRETFAARLAEAYGSDAAPDVDLLIRTGGEQRLSDFLLWECAYAELYFTRVLWPDFGAEELTRAVAEFHGRERRFGAIPRAAAG
jgi:undecaprenyl diphosphate synthase